MLTENVQKQSKSKSFWLLLIVSAITILFIANGAISANNDRNLERDAIQVDDLFRNSRRVNAEYIEADSMSHPLAETNHDIDEVDTILYNYEKAYTTSTFAPEEAVFVASYLYQYASAEDASVAAQHLQDRLQQDGNVSLTDGANRGGEAWEGHAYELAGSDGDTINWFIGVKNDVVYLLMVNGLERELIRDSFDRVMFRFTQN